MLTLIHLTLVKSSIPFTRTGTVFGLYRSSFVMGKWMPFRGHREVKRMQDANGCIDWLQASLLKRSTQATKRSMLSSKKTVILLLQAPSPQKVAQAQENIRELCKIGNAWQLGHRCSKRTHKRVASTTYKHRSSVNWRYRRFPKKALRCALALPRNDLRRTDRPRSQVCTLHAGCKSKKSARYSWGVSDSIYLITPFYSTYPPLFPTIVLTWYDL